MLRNKKYGMGGAVQSFSSPMLAQGMQGGLSGFGTSGLQTFAKGGRMSNVEMGRMKIKDWYKKNYKTDELGDELNPNTTFDDLFSAILNGDVYSAMGVHDSVVRERLFSKLSKIKGRYENYAYELYMKYGDKPLGRYAKGGEIDGLEILDKSDEYGEKYDVFVNGLKQGHISKTRDEKYFVMSDMTNGGKPFNGKFFDSLLKAKKYVYSKTKNIFPLTSKTMMKKMGYAKGGEIIDQYEGRTPADIWFNLTKSQRRHLLLDHANIPSGEISMYVGYDTNYDDLPHFVKQIVKKHFAEGQYAKGGQIASIGDSGIITDKNSMFVGKMALITGDLGNMYEVRVGERTTIVKKNGIRIISDEYADGGKTRKSGNVPKIAKKVAEVNALIEKGNELGVEVVDSSSTWQSPMKYKPIKYVNGILYIEYEELDLYSHLKRGVNQWKLRKDKVLKRNMEFDNPLNDIAKMYRKAIREREQYFSDGGDVQDMNRYSSARTMGRDSQNWEAELKEFAGEHYKSLTPREREEIIADIQRGYDRNTHFAKGGKITHSNESRNISDEEKRATYVLAFGQEYDDESRRQHPLPLDIAYQVALHSLERKKNEMAKGGQTSTYEVHLEAVPNIDYDQSDYRANVRVSKLKKSAKSIGEAVRIAKNFIEDNDLGSGNFIPAKLYKNGKQIGFISYNGRVWNNDQSEMKYAEGGEVGKDYVFVGNTMMNGEYKPVYKKDNKYYLKYYNPTKYKFLADEKDIKNYRIGRATDTYAKGGEVDELKVGDIVTHRKGRKYGHGRIYKTSSIGIYLEDKYGNKREQPFLSPSDFKKVKKMFSDGGEVKKIDFSNFLYDTEGDYEEIEQEKEKIKYLRTKIDFDQVRGHINTSQIQDNTNLRFYKNGNLVMTIQGDWNENTSELDSILKIGEEIVELNYHPLDSMGGFDLFTFKRDIDSVFRDLGIYSAVVSIEGYEEYAEEVEGLDKAKQVIQDIKGNTKFQIVKGKREGLGKRIDTSKVLEEYAKGGEIGELVITEGKGANKKTWVVTHPKIKEKGVYFQDETSKEEAKQHFYDNVLKLYRFAKGGEVVQLPPKGELTNRDNLLLKYQKVGSNYEFYIYEPIVKKVSGYNQTKYVCKNSDCALKMNYKEFINYLYSELYLDDKKFAKGGVVRNNKFQSNLEELLKQEGFQVSYYDNNVNEMPKEKAEVISLTKWSPYYENFILKLPSKMEVTFEWIMNKLSNDKVYKSFAENFNKILKAKGYSNLNAYPTSYGIGVFVGFGRGIEETKTQIEELLNSLGIEYKTEYSEAGYVFRYRISKSKENISKINEIEMTYAKGGKIGFEGLAKKVAKRYVGKKVSKEYQSEYGKTYDAKEAKEVGNKVAGKVYQQQVAKKKIVRKLQRKTK